MMERDANDLTDEPNTARPNSRNVWFSDVTNNSGKTHQIVWFSHVLKQIGSIAGFLLVSASVMSVVVIIKNIGKKQRTAPYRLN
jgi:hypothetical protein